MNRMVAGSNATAPFSLTVRRGEGMALLSMNWCDGTPPNDFVGFAISFRPPNSAEKFLYVSNRLTFEPTARTNRDAHRSLVAPIQMFRWVSFPAFVHVAGDYTYRVAPVFMDAHDKLSYGESQEATIELGGFTRPGELDVAFTRGFVSSQAFVDRYGLADGAEMSTLLPNDDADPLTFTPTSKKASEALPWMGFEARDRILRLLDQAVQDQTAEVRVVAYDLNLREVVDRLEQLGSRLKIIVDNSVGKNGTGHGAVDSSESQASARLRLSAGEDHVARQHLGNLQHNKFIAVGGDVQRVLCGSTNFSWRGVYVQNNHTVQLLGADALDLFTAAFDSYWEHGTGKAKFAASALSDSHELTWPSTAAQVTFSPHTADNSMLHAIADDISGPDVHSVLYSLAFLYQTSGPVRDAITTVTENPNVFVYGISDREIDGIDLAKPDGNVQPVHPANISGDVPEPFRSEPIGGGGIRMHHKFVVINFGRPDARVWLGSYNFSKPADQANGENLLLIRDPAVTDSFAIEALRIFDHYAFRVKQQDAGRKLDQLMLQKSPRSTGEAPWWAKYFDGSSHERDRELFA